MKVYNQLEQTPIEELVLQVQQGDEEKHDYLLTSYQPFMISVISQVCKRYIDPRQDDEFSIGLSAFNDAIFLYCPTKGCSFLSFAKLIVSRKVIDYIRYNSKRQNDLSFDTFYDEETMENPAEVSAVIEQYQDEQDAINRREETLEYRKKLKEFNLSLLELTEVAPKHRDSRETAVRIARMLNEDDELKQYVLAKKKLPIKKLEKRVSVSKKTIERNRKYILAMFIVLQGNFTYLKEYLKEVG
ncbi:RNA polymerase sigma-I factor [Oceanobacillus luteolus]|uniref:RNA polymerase sigma factor SigI n=1 Tax=Oceanobacillus luteolus TaxID=1274358 RepID=A0ABW4HSH0_9BACI|nr:RNA polymerase sigma-I factor [Oceanobacillus luteolus]MCM3739603.1 RNA polymerase sigma-I factor [Oceanobacillus luteolus]